MSDLSYSALIRDLSKHYYYRQIARQDYRHQRRELLERIDEEYNGRNNSNIEDLEQPATQQHDQSMLMKTIAFFKNKDVDE